MIRLSKDAEREFEQFSSRSPDPILFGQHEIRTAENRIPDGPSHAPDICNVYDGDDTQVIYVPEPDSDPDKTQIIRLF